MDGRLATRRSELLALTRRSADPKVRHRAHVLLDAIDSPSIRVTAERMGVSVASIRRWRERWLTEGAPGLRDRPHPGRPSLLPTEARELLGQALERDPMADGYPTATWTIADLTDLLARRGWTVSSATVHRAVHALGYVHRRPRHDLAHRQNAEAVASGQHTLAVLQKRGLISPAACACSISTSVTFIPIPTWQKDGNGGERHAGFRPPEPISG